MSDADSLPVASAVEQLTIAAARVQAVWKRTGVPALDRRQKWDTFLSQSMLPFLRDFCALQEAAEFNAAAENDTLLREVCYLATRLDEVPRDANVAVLAALLKRHYRRTPMASPLLAARRVGGHEEEQEKGGTRPSCATREEGEMDSGDSDSSRPGDTSQRGSRELMFLSLPSFTQLVSDAAKAGRDGDDAEWVKSDEESSDSDKETEEEAKLNEEEARTCGTNGPVSSASTTAAFSPVFSVKADSTACATAAGTGNESTADAAQALRRLMHANTHEGVRQQLQSELVRLQSLADHRLRVLQLLCKQRALLSRCPADQVVLRAAYRAKFLDGHEGVGALERLTATSSSSSSSAALQPSANANVNNSVDTSTAAAAAARQAAEKEVGEFLRTAEKTNASCGPDGALFTAVDTASAVRNAAAATAAVGATRKTISVSPPTSSHFVSFPPSPKSSANSTNAPSSVGGGEDSAMNRVQQQQQKATALQDATKAELELLLSTAPCTVDGVPAYEKRDTCVGDAPPPQQNPQNTANHNNSSSSSGCGKCHGEGRGTEASGVSWPTCSATTAGPVTACVSCRPTVLEVDVSSVTAFGTHQDLTLRRIQQESEAIVAAIAAHNRRMQAEAADELKALETLDVLWRAMSAQRRSPATSTQLGSGSSTKTSGGGGNADGVAIPSDTLLMQPVPFAETMAEVLTRYRQLCDAFSADVAAERTAAGSLAGGALALSHSGSHHPSSSSPSSAASSVRPTHASGGDSASPAASLRPSSTSKGSFYIPPCVRHVLRAASFAPVLDYVHRTRVAFQQHLSTQQDRLVDKVMQRLREVYATYYAATRDGAYAVAPDGDLRVAVEEEMLESLQTASSSSASGGVDSAEAVVDGPTVPFSGTTRTAAAAAQADKVLVSFQRHLTACQQVREQAADEIEFLQLRLHIIQQAEPLVRDYHDIVREEADMHATSRERLLSKKVNMAKQLLQEEKVRRRVAKELPRIVAQLTELMAAWDALQSAVDPRQDSAPAREVAELCIHGQRVRDLLAAAAARARPRSAVSRSVSPAPPSLARPRVEGAGTAHAVTSHGMMSSAQRRATPSPTPSTPKPPSAQRLRHHTTTTTAAVSPSQLSQRTPRTPPLQRTLSRSPSFATAEVTNRKRPASSARSVSPSVAAKAPAYAFAQPSQRTQQQQQQQHRGPPTPPLVPSVGLSTRVRSASPAQRSGLSQRPANTPDVRGKAMPSGATTSSVPFSTFTRPHH